MTSANGQSGSAQPDGRRPMPLAGLGAKIILGALMGFGALSTDLYLPALPRMADALQAGHGDMELTISSYLVGFSLGQLFWGPIGDRFGRRAPVLVGLLLFTLGSVGCALSDDVVTIIVARVVQACGACAGVVLARAMVRDLYDRDRAAQMLSSLIMVMAVAPLLAPLVGAFIIGLWSWRSIFWLMAAIGLATMAAVLRLPETLPPALRYRHGVGDALRSYAALIRDRHVMGYAIVGGCYYAGSFAFIAGSPFAYMEHFGATPGAYGALFGAAIFGIIGCNFINTRMVANAGSDAMLRGGTIGAALTGAVVALLAMTGWGGLAAFALFLTLFVSMSGLIVANSLAGAMARAPIRVGGASALVGTIHYGSGIVGSGLVAFFADGTLLPLGFVIAASGLLSLLCTRLLR